ncbi:hypothetical protein ACFSTE_00205 [Aquimarina hainanensis]|uniref:Bulb-type lectin domain-containing protein n=1 Tax=Aquimarina hainanensis TaxID=1578017 RepID=A0ABW5N399_9FLAO|nr:hypothetical protein [Aquimarina sp. TRL1]QKX04647.1 hypothetical protein HN014_06875 [Aquimarina sp. TRL1]
MNTSKISIYTIAFVITLTAISSCSNDDEGTPPKVDEKIERDIEWVKTYGGSNEDNALSVVETTDGGYAVAGYTQSIDGDITGKTATDSDFWLLKLSPSGEILWNKTYGGTGDERAEKIIQTNDGGFVMVGYSRSTDGDVSVNAGLQDYWVLKTDSSGTLEWEKSFGFPGIDRAFSALQTKDGGFFITGFLDVTASDGGGNDDKNKNEKHGVGEFWGIKLDANGEKQWRRYFGGSNNDRSYDVIETEDQGFIMIGSSESEDFDISNSKGSYDFWAVKVDAKGTKVWEKSYGGSQIDISYAIAAAGNGKYLIIGDSRSEDGDISNPKGNADLWIIQIDDKGSIQWKKSIGGTAFDTGRGIYKTKEGNFIITGNSRSGDVDLTKNNGQSDIWNLIIGPDGNVKWSQTVGGTEAEYGNGCIETKDKKIIIVGNSESSDFDITTNKGVKDVVVIKYK